MIFFFAHLVSAVTGFGSNVLGLPLLVLVVGLDPAKQSLIVLGALMYTYLSIRWWKRVDTRQLLWIILVTGAGLILGILLFQYLPQRASTIALALFVTLVGLRGLFNIAPHIAAPRWFAQLTLFLGGIVHGAFTIGGPLISVYAKRAIPHKSAFRSTLAVMWLLLATGLMIAWTLTHSWHPQTPRVTLAGLPFLIAGLVTGEYLHHRANEAVFRVVVNITLTTVGAVLLWGVLH